MMYYVTVGFSFMGFPILERCKLRSLVEKIDWRKLDVLRHLSK